MADTADLEQTHSGTPAGKRPQWSSERSFVLSTAAAGVGLGNLWRFPYVLGDNGGGAFLIAYLLAVVVVAVPFATLEIAAGRIGHGGVVATFRRLARPAAIYGWAVVALTLLINSYYFVVSGWTLSYAASSTLGNIPSFSTYTEGWGSVIGLVAVTGLVGIVLGAGLSGIERFAKFLVPVLVLTVLGLAIYALVTGAAGEALSFLFAPDLASLADPALWSAAFGQAFYSLAIGQGYLITYGSYLPKKVNVPRSIGIVAATNAGVAMVAGLMIFPLVFRFDLDPAAGSALAFEVMPQAFAEMTGGGFIAVVFFWLFFLAAFSSAIAGANVVVTPIREALPVGGKGALAIGLGAILIAGLPSAFSYAAPGWTIGGQPVLDAVDSFAGSGIVVISGFVGACITAWALTRQRWQTVLARAPSALLRATVLFARWASLPAVGVLVFIWFVPAGG